MAGKMGNKLVALCTVALGAVYATGYVVTNTPQVLGANALKGNTTATSQPSNHSEGQGSHASGNTTETSNSPNSNSSNAGEAGSDASGSSNTSTGQKSSSTSKAATISSSRSSGGASSAAQNSNDNATTSASSNGTTSKSRTSNQKYLDGTYHGSGTTRIGTVWVAVTIKSGKITNVQITQADTHYPTSYIDPVLPQEVIQRQSANVDLVSGATLSSDDFSTGVQKALQQAQNPNYKA